jgi:hypothetical protein
MALVTGPPWSLKHIARINGAGDRPTLVVEAHRPHHGRSAEA